MSSTSHQLTQMESSTSQLHVLAVDDSRTDRKIIEKLLKKFSYKVTAVDSGSRALEFLGLEDDSDSVNEDLQAVSMIITDYNMPGISGYDLLKRIKESSKFKDIPVVIMSSDNGPSLIRRCLEEGAEEFIVKPVRLADVRRLRSYIGGDQ